MHLVVPLLLVAAMLAATALGWWVVAIVLAVAAVGWWTSLAARGRVGAPLIDSNDSERDVEPTDRKRVRGIGLSAPLTVASHRW